jgi:hypothetical protein
MIFNVTVQFNFHLRILQAANVDIVTMSSLAIRQIDAISFRTGDSMREEGMHYFQGMLQLITPEGWTCVGERICSIQDRLAAGLVHSTNCRRPHEQGRTVGVSASHCPNAGLAASALKPPNLHRATFLSQPFAPRCTAFSSAGSSILYMRSAGRRFALSKAMGGNDADGAEIGRGCPIHAEERAWSSSRPDAKADR